MCVETSVYIFLSELYHIKHPSSMQDWLYSLQSNQCYSCTIIQILAPGHQEWYTGFVCLSVLYRILCSPIHFFGGIIRQISAPVNQECYIYGLCLSVYLFVCLFVCLFPNILSALQSVDSSMIMQILSSAHSHGENRIFAITFTFHSGPFPMIVFS